MKKGITIIYFIAIFILFYVLDCYSYFIIDDLHYAFIHGGSWRPVKSLPDAITSQLYDWGHVNGRVIVHTVVQLFCSSHSLVMYRIINSLMFCLLWLGMLKLVRKNAIGFKHDGIVVLSLLFIGMPAIGMTALGNVSYGVNYLWTGVFIVWLLNLYSYLRSHGEVRPIWLNIGILLFSLLTCSLQESFSIPVAGALFLYYCFKRDELKGSLRFLVAGVFIGTCIVCVTPASVWRLSLLHNEGSTFLSLVGDTIVSMMRLARYAVVTDCLVLLVITAYFRDKKQCLKFLKDNSLLLLANGISIIFMVFVALTTECQTMCLELFSMILVYNLICTSFPGLQRRAGRWVAGCCVVLLTFFYITAFITRKHVSEVYESFIADAANCKDGYVAAKGWELYCQHADWLTTKYTFPSTYLCMDGMNPDRSKLFLSYFLTYGKDGNFIRHILPMEREEIIECCKEENRTGEYVYKLPPTDCYAVRLPEGIIPGRIDVTVRKKIYLYVIDKMLGGTGTDAISYNWRASAWFDHNGYRYYIISYDRHKPIISIEVSPDDEGEMRAKCAEDVAQAVEKV